MWNAAEWKCGVKCVLTDAEGAQHVLPPPPTGVQLCWLCVCARVWCFVNGRLNVFQDGASAVLVRLARQRIA